MKNLIIAILLVSSFFACKKDDETTTSTPTPVDYTGTYSGPIFIDYPNNNEWDTTIQNFVFNITKSGDNYTIVSEDFATDNAIFTISNGTITRVSGNKIFSKELTGTISSTELKIQFSGVDDDNDAFSGTYTGTKKSSGSGGSGTNTEKYGYIVYNGTKYDGVHANLSQTGSKGCIIHSTLWTGTSNADDEMINIILPAGAGTYSSDGCGDPRLSGNPNDWVALDLPNDLSNDFSKLMETYHYKSGTVKKTIEGDYEVIEFDLVVVNRHDASKTTNITGKMRGIDD